MAYSARTPKQFGEILRGIRASRQLTQAQVAERVGLTQKSISMLEADPSRAGLERIFRLLSALDVELVLQDKAQPKSGKASW